MILAKDFEDFVKLLNQHKVEYMIVGGYALGFHGSPRYTGDLDIWINISERNAKRMLQVIKDFGVASMGFEKNDFLKPGYVSQIGYPPLRIDILNGIDGVAFDQAIKSLQKIELGAGFMINYIGVDDLIKNKQAAGRKQDLIDIREIRKKQAGKKTQKKKK